MRFFNPIRARTRVGGIPLQRVSTLSSLLQLRLKKLGGKFDPGILSAQARTIPSKSINPFAVFITGEQNGHGDGKNASGGKFCDLVTEIVKKKTTTMIHLIVCETPIGI